MIKRYYEQIRAVILHYLESSSAPWEIFLGREVFGIVAWSHRVWFKDILLANDGGQNHGAPSSAVRSKVIWKVLQDPDWSGISRRWWFKRTFPQQKHGFWMILAHHGRPKITVSTCFWHTVRLRNAWNIQQGRPLWWRAVDGEGHIGTWSHPETLLVMPPSLRIP